MTHKNWNHRRYLHLLLIPVVLFFASCQPESVAQDETLSLPAELAFYQAPPAEFEWKGGREGEPKNVILMIGDGMGPVQVELASRRALPKDRPLWMETLPVNGTITTDNISSDTTDSAAAATAMACGIKTKNGRIGQDADKQDWINIRELLEQHGWHSGIVATSAVTHATPAGFASHVRSRGQEEDIAEQMAASGAEVILGGGSDYWRRDLTQQRVEQAGYQLVSSLEELEAADAMPVLGLFQKKELTTFEPEPSLEEMTRAAIRLLSSPASHGSKAPFFLMVEGSQIDWACHAHDDKKCVRQTLLFDMAVRAAMEFARKDGNTLVIVTADHETGGMSLRDVDEDPTATQVSWSTSGHTSDDVPLYAFGPGADAFDGKIDNIDLPKTIARLLLEEVEFPRRLTEAEQTAALQTVP